MQKRIKKISIFLGIFFIIGLCGAFFFIHSDGFLNWVETRLVTEIEYLLTEDYTASIGGIEGSILGNVTVNDITISKNDAPDEPVISTEKVVLQYHLLGLFTRKLEITQLTVTKPRIGAKPNTDGSLNLAHVFKGNTTQDAEETRKTTQDAAEFDFAVERIECNSGIIDYIDTQRDIHIEIIGVSIDVEGPLDTWRHKGELRIGSGSLSFNGSETEIDNFQADFQLLANRNTLDKFQLEFGDSNLAVTGEFPHPETGTPWAIKFDLQQLNIADVEAFFGKDIELEGIVKADLTITGTDTALDGTLSVEAPTLSATQAENNRQISLTDLKIDASLNSEPTLTFSLRTFSTQIADGTLTGAGSIGLQSEFNGDVITLLQQLTQHPIVYEGQWNATDMQLIPLLSMVVQLPDYLSESAGLVSGTATFSGDGTDFSTLKLNSRVEVTETILNEMEFENSVLNCTIAAGALKADGNLDETDIVVTGAFPLAQQGTLDLHISGINFDELSKITNNADFGGTGEYTAKLSANGVLTGFMEIPNASFTDIPLGVLSGDLRYQEGQVFIENGYLTKNTKADTLTEYESRATINGVVDIEDEYPAVFSIVTDPVYVQHYRNILVGADYPINGEIRGELKLEGTLANLDGRADFRVTEAEALDVHLDPITLPVRIEDYNITVPNCEITTRGQKVILNASVDTNANFDFLLESDAPVHLEEIAKAAEISDFPFEAQFDVRFVGTLKKPEPADFQIQLDFTDITFLDYGRGTKHPLGHANLRGKLVSGEPDRYDFTGNGFDGQIHGYVSTAPDTPYEFVVESTALEVTPFLRILNPALEAITGTADGRAKIKGTVAALAPADESESSASDRPVYPYDVNIEVHTSQLRYGNSTESEIVFTNPKQIQLHLKDDKWTIDAFALRVLADKSDFIELTGTYDAKSEMMDLHAKSDKFALSSFAPVFGLPRDMLQTGTGRYTLKSTGTPEHPIVALDWEIPTLDLKTEVGDIYISEAGGGVEYRDNLIYLKRNTLKLFGNAVDIDGEITVHPEAINNSRLNLNLNAPELKLKTFGEFIATVSENTIKVADLTAGALAVSMDIGGTVTETSIAVNAQTAPQQPMRLVPFTDPITLARLRTNAILNSESLHVRSVEANGLIGGGSYSIQGDASFSTENTEAMQFAIDVSASQLEISDFLTLLSDQTTPVHGTVSGHAKLHGTGIHQHQVSIIAEINKLNLRGYGNTATNTTPLQFRSEQGNLAAHLPLELKAPGTTATTNVNIIGTFDAPEITAKWNGYINEMEWNGEIQYGDERITVVEVALKNRAGISTITGVIPFNLAFTAIDMSDRFLEQPIDIQFQGRELPIAFLPGIDRLFSETDGTVDIDLALQGTSREPHIAGDVLLEASQLQLRNFHEPIQNLKMQLKARGDTIDLTELGFDIGSGYCTLQQGQLALSGLIPKKFKLVGLKLEKFPLGSTVRHAVPPEALEAVEGHLSTVLNELTIPLDSFLTNGENTPFPQIQEIPLFSDIVAVSSANVSIDSVRLAFRALDRDYDFQDPQPIQIQLNAGTVTLSEAFTLENQFPFSVRQTFTAEDEKPEGVTGKVHTVEDAKTTLSIDAGSQWSMNGEFDAALRLKNFDVSAITASLPLPYRVTGALSGSLQVSGTSENPKITLRRHKSEPAELYLHDVPIDLRWRIRYQNGKWEISKKRYVEVNFGENLLTFSWTMPYQLELIPFFMELQRSPETVWKELQKTDMDAIVDIVLSDLDILSSVVPGLRSPTGTSTIYVVLTGAMETPHAEGRVSFKDIGFELPDASIHGKEITGDIQLSESGATVKRIEGILNDGKFLVAGEVMTPEDGRIWETSPTLDLNTSISAAVFEQPGKYQVTLGSDLTELHLRGGFDDPYLTGDLNISTGDYQQNWESVRDWLAGASVTEMDVALDYPILRHLNLDVGVNIPDNFRVLSSITGPTDIEIAGSGRLIGRIQNPVFNGNISILRGKIFFLQTFELIEGSRITNRSTDEFDPELNISLRTPNSIRGVLPRNQSTVDLEIYARLTGTSTNPEFVLSAPNAPEVLSHEDIFTFLVRNAAFSHALGGFTFNFHRPLDEEARSISAEYQLRENMSIKIESNEKGEYGVDVGIKGRF
ncbi:translocation/assembly module TamB domain-containing protein [Candidatus Poribacteria bacterium]|nr:translocation/assembly module TamB domain-containing protein [Candidatus Poribacteria bacterium]